MLMLCRHLAKYRLMLMVRALPYFSKLYVSDIGADFITVTAHKINGPKGCGALFCRNGGPKWFPLIYGGHQEQELRSGTEASHQISAYICYATSN